MAYQRNAEMNMLGNGIEGTGIDVGLLNKVEKSNIFSWCGSFLFSTFFPYFPLSSNYFALLFCLRLLSHLLNNHTYTQYTMRKMMYRRTRNNGLLVATRHR